MNADEMVIDRLQADLLTVLSDNSKTIVGDTVFGVSFVSAENGYRRKTSRSMASSVPSPGRPAPMRKSLAAAALYIAVAISGVVHVSVVLAAGPVPPVQEGNSVAGKYKAAMDAKRWPQAYELATKLTDAAPSSSLAWYRRARAAAFGERWDDAKQALDKAKTLDPAMKFSQDTQRVVALEDKIASGLDIQRVEALADKLASDLAIQHSIAGSSSSIAQLVPAQGTAAAVPASSVVPAAVDPVILPVSATASVSLIQSDLPISPSVLKAIEKESNHRSIEVVGSRDSVAPGSITSMLAALLGGVITGDSVTLTQVGSFVNKTATLAIVILLIGGALAFALYRQTATSRPGVNGRQKKTAFPGSHSHEGKIAMESMKNPIFIESENVMHTMLFYKNPTVLNKETHKDLRIQRLSQPHFDFAAKTNSVMLAGVEFALAAMDYPIVFNRLSGGKFVALALLGLRDHENLFVSADGLWKEGAYIPAFVRRYPFVPADVGDDTLQVCIDEAYAGFVGESGDPLFEADGKPSEMLEQAMALLQDYDGQCKRTEAFTQKLQDLGLFKEISLRAAMHADGAEYALNGVHIVDEQKLLDLPEKDVFELFQQGHMAWLYAHLMSQAKLGGLVNELAQRRDLLGTHPEALKPQQH